MESDPDCHTERALCSQEQLPQGSGLEGTGIPQMSWVISQNPPLSLLSPRDLSQLHLGTLFSTALCCNRLGMKNAGVRGPFLILLSPVRWCTATFGASPGLREIFDNLSRTLLPPFCCSSLIHQDNVHPWDVAHHCKYWIPRNLPRKKCPTLCNSSVVELDNIHMRISHQREEEPIKARNIDWFTNNFCLVTTSALAARIFRFTTSAAILATLA